MTEHYWLINEMLPEMRNNAFGEVMPPEVLRWQGMLPDSGRSDRANGQYDRRGAPLLRRR